MITEGLRLKKFGIDDAIKRPVEFCVGGQQRNLLIESKLCEDSVIHAQRQPHRQGGGPLQPVGVHGMNPDTELVNDPNGRNEFICGQPTREQTLLAQHSGNLNPREVRRLQSYPAVQEVVPDLAGVLVARLIDEPP